MKTTHNDNRSPCGTGRDGGQHSHATATAGHHRSDENQEADEEFKEAGRGWSTNKGNPRAGHTGTLDGHTRSERFQETKAQERLEPIPNTLQPRPSILCQRLESLHQQRTSSWTARQPSSPRRTPRARCGF
jgi:hypothetical protein